MTLDYIYGIIRGLNKAKRVNSDGFFYGIDDKDAVRYMYCFEDGSGFRLIGPRDLNNDFYIIEIDEKGVQYIKVFENGMESEIKDLSTEEQFFQENTCTDLVFSFDDYAELYNAFMKYYNGFMNHLTVYLWK